jgi:hypothetical protein
LVLEKIFGDVWGSGWGCAYGIWWAEARNIDKHPTVLRAASPPHKRNYLDQTLVPRLRNLEI